MASFEDTYEGLDDAEVEERLPELPEDSDFVLELVKIEEFTARKPPGKALALSFKVIDSTSEKARKGQIYGKRLLGMTDPNRKKFQFGRVKQLIGGLHNIEPTSTQKWVQILAAMVKTQCRKGWLFSAQTGVKTTSQGGHEYVPINFGPPPADAPMPPKQAEKFA